MKPCLSSVACPELPLRGVFEVASASGFQGVELRTEGPASRGWPSDPALTAPAKARALADRFGIPVLSLGTCCRFDEPVWPPVLGHALTDTERPIRDGKWHVDLAVSLECPLVRVFAFEPPPRERAADARQRIADRLRLVVAHAHRTGVRVSLENGGAFPRAADVAALLDLVQSPLLGVSYNVAEAHRAGEAPQDGVNVLGDALLSLRVKDVLDGVPCIPGEGSVPVERAVRAAGAMGFAGPVIWEWDRAWFPSIAPVSAVAEESARRLTAWAAPSAGATRSHAAGAGV